MTAIADFERYVLPFVNNAPVPAVEDAVLDACVEFCRRTKVLREILPAITVKANVGEIELDSPDSSTSIGEVLAAWLPEGQIFPYTRADLDATYPGGWASQSVSTSREVTGFHCRLPGLLRLVPMVSADQPLALTVEVALVPKRGAKDVADVLFERYAEDIAAGALARLHQHPNVAYADASRVASYSQAFERAITILADDGNRGFARKQLRTIGERL